MGNILTTVSNVSGTIMSIFFVKPVLPVIENIDEYVNNFISDALMQLNKNLETHPQMNTEKSITYIQSEDLRKKLKDLLIECKISSTKITMSHAFGALNDHDHGRCIVTIYVRDIYNKCNQWWIEPDAGIAVCIKGGDYDDIGQ